MVTRGTDCCREGGAKAVRAMVGAEVTDEPVLTVSVVGHLIRSEAGSLVAVEEAASLLTRLPQRISILCVGLDVPTKDYSWSAELLIQQKHEPVLKAKASSPWQHSIGTGRFVGPDEFVVRRGQRQEPNRHARGRRATIQWLRSL